MPHWHPYVQLQDDTVDGDHNQSSSEVSVRISGECDIPLGPDKRDGSQTKEYSVDSIVKHVGNG